MTHSFAFFSSRILIFPPPFIATTLIASTTQTPSHESSMPLMPVRLCLCVVKRFPHSLRSVILGHMIGSHTWSHADLTTVSIPLTILSYELLTPFPLFFSLFSFSSPPHKVSNKRK